MMAEFHFSASFHSEIKWAGRYLIQESIKSCYNNTPQGKCVLKKNVKREFFYFKSKLNYLVLLKLFFFFGLF